MLTRVVQLFTPLWHQNLRAKMILPSFEKAQRPFRVELVRGIGNALSKVNNADTRSRIAGSMTRQHLDLDNLSSCGQRVLVDAKARRRKVRRQITHHLKDGVVAGAACP